MQVIWDLCHYGWPDDLDVFSPSFVDRFARFVKAVAEIVADSSDAVPFYTPVNEISFLTMAVGTGIMYPFVAGRDAELKRQLVRAAMAAMDAACAVDRRARFVFAEPVIHVVPPADRPDQHEAASRARDSQFEVWDMLSDQRISGHRGSELLSRQPMGMRGRTVALGGFPARPPHVAVPAPSHGSLPALREAPFRR